jgi:hypothetical protein
MRPVALIGLSMFVTGCATTQPLSGSDIEYRLPRTDAVATVTLTLKSCDNYGVDGTIAVAPQAGVSARGYRIPGASLASARIKRSLKISKNANDVMIGVNSTVADQSPQIAGNIIKTAATFLPLLASGVRGGTPPKCNALTAALTKRAEVRAKQLSALNASTDEKGGKDNGGGGNGGAGDRSASLDAISKELASIKTALTITFTVPLDVPDKEADAETNQPAAIREPFMAWFDNPTKEQIAALFGIEWRLVKDPVVFADVTAPARPVRASRSCGFSIPVPYARRMTIDVVGTGEKVTTLKKSVPAFVGNWDKRELCIDAGFGETRTNELAFDDFGHETSANWSSEARAATITGAIAGSAGDVSTIITTIAPPTVKAEKVEIDQLQTQQTLNKLRACKAVIEAGGSTCPSQ